VYYFILHTYILTHSTSHHLTLLPHHLPYTILHVLLLCLYIFLLLAKYIHTLIIILLLCIYYTYFFFIYIYTYTTHKVYEAQHHPSPSTLLTSFPRQSLLFQLPTLIPYHTYKSLPKRYHCHFIYTSSPLTIKKLYTYISIYILYINTYIYIIH
jgi:hypothetical protein